MVRVSHDSITPYTLLDVSPGSVWAEFLGVRARVGSFAWQGPMLRVVICLQERLLYIGVKPRKRTDAFGDFPPGVLIDACSDILYAN